MLKKKSSKLLALLLVFSLVFIAGCQAVGVVDFNQMLKNSLKVTSSEGKQSFEFQLHLNEEMLAEASGEEATLMNMISHIKLELDNVKMQDSSHISFDGRLYFGEDTSLGFAMQMSNTVAVIELEGAKQPFVIDMTGATYLDMMGLEYELDTEITQVDQESLTALGHQLIDSIGNYAIDNLPNPKDIQVSPIYEQINGVGTPLLHVQFDMDGLQIFEWIKSYVEALLNDRAGLDRMITEVFEILSTNPDLKEAWGEFNPFDSGEQDAPTVDEMAEEASEAIAELLEQLKLDLEEEEMEGSIRELLSDNLVIKSDIYVDYMLNIRKQKFELSYSLPEDNEDFDVMLLPFTGFTLKSESESWNINGDVKSDAPVITEDAIGIEELVFMEGYELLKQFEEDSFIYNLLKNEFQVGHQSFVTFNQSEYNPPYIMPGWITIVPIREVADAFGATIEYDPATKTISLYDEATETLIITQVGNDIAFVNGEEVQWSYPTTIIDGTGYVAARSLSEALGADIEWITIDEESNFKLLMIEREL